jgi:hypothetical protein
MSDELGLELRKLVEQARLDEDSPPQPVKRRVRNAVSLAIPAGALFGSKLVAASETAASASLGAATAGKVGAGLLHGFLAWVAGGFVIGLGATTAYVGRPQLDNGAQPTSRIATAKRASNSGLSTPTGRAASVAAFGGEFSESANASAAAPTPTAPLSPALATHAASSGGQTPTALQPMPSLADEVALLARVQQKLRDGQGQAALEAVAEAERRFADAQLHADFQAARVLAWCELGQTAAARQAAESFLRVYPGSPLAERVRHSCAFRGVRSDPAPADE